MTIREALIAMSYTEARPGHWIKPIAFQAFSYLESKGEWSCWFKPNDGSQVALMERKTFGDVSTAGDYIRQLKEFEQWTKHNVYTPSHFELGAFDL